MFILIIDMSTYLTQQHKIGSMKFWGLIIGVLLLCNNLWAQQPNTKQTTTEQTTAEQLFNKFKAAARFDYNFPREKVYLHLDNSAYFEGDTIWYKAYVVRASSLKSTTLSKVLYVELLNADGQEVLKQTLQIDSLGTAQGALSLALPVHAGYHEVRAYTREMVNWGTDACFSRVIPVFTGKNPQKKQDKTLDTDITQLSIPQPDGYNAGTLGSPRPYDMKRQSARLLDFYPEGGARVEGCAQRIAFKLTDGRGLPVDDTLKVYDSNGKLCTTALAEHEGMGDFVLPPHFNQGYATLASAPTADKKSVESKKHYPLPDATGQYAMLTDVEADGLVVQVASGKHTPLGQLLGLAVFNRENVCYFDTLTLGTAPEELFIERRALRGGVNRIELFNAEGISQATRMVWVPFEHTDSIRFAHIDVKQNALEYDAYSPAVLSIKAQTATGKPLADCTLSVAVRDEAGNILSNRDGGIEGYMLLGSEVRGYIHRPDLYFERNDAAHRRMLDLLLRVQGWTANTFNVMCGAEKFNLQQPIEEKLILRGTIYKDNEKQTPFSDINLDVRAYAYENGNILPGSIEGQATTDHEGKFAFESNVNYEGEYLTQFTMRGGDKNKKKWSRLTIDRWFSPKPRPLFTPELTLNLYDGSDNQTRILLNAHPEAPRTFEWKDTLQKNVINITKTAEVVAKAKQKYKGFTGNRYTWKGGERTGMRKTTKYYDVQKEYERLKDLGRGSKISIFELLSLLDEKVSFDRYDLMDNSSLIERLNAEANELNNNSPNGSAANSNTTNGKANVQQKKERMEDVALSTVNYKGHEMKVYIDNSASLGQLSDCEYYKSIALARDNKSIDNITGKEYTVSESLFELYLYSQPDSYRMRNRKGVEYRHIQGFSSPTKFFAPNYRKFALPSDNDTRRTLHWAPQVTTNSDGEAHIIFFTNSRKDGTLDISVRGITPEGILIEWN